MLSIKQFITKVSSMEGKHGKAVILSMEEARQLRDDLACLMADKLESHKEPQEITVEIVGGKF